MLKNIEPGKLYWNKQSRHTWDEIICPVEVDKGYVEYYFLERPDKGVKYVLPITAMDNWEEYDL